MDKSASDFTTVTSWAIVYQQRDQLAQSLREICNIFKRHADKLNRAERDSSEFDALERALLLLAKIEARELATSTP